MEPWSPTPITPDPAPALTRGLAILSTLTSKGATTLEALVRETGFPKTSVLRLLTAMTDCGAVERDELTKRYSARITLFRREETGMTLIHRAREVMSSISQTFGHTCELYRHFPSGLTMIERVEPDEVTVVATARLGHYRDLTEIESLSLVYRACIGDPARAPRKGLWQWDEHCKAQPIKLSVVNQLIKETQQQGYAFDLTINPNGVRRYSVPVFSQDNGKSLWGILSIAQVVHPANPNPNADMIQAMTDAGQILSGQSNSVNT
jgi:DNA-binding IclR family transcriptional regulator